MINQLDNLFATLAFKAPNIDALESMTDQWMTVPRIRIQAESNDDGSDRVAPESIDDMCRYHPDIIIRLVPKGVYGDVLSIAQHGVWSLRHSDSRTLRGTPTGFWEWYRRKLTTSATLERDANDTNDNIAVLRQTYRTHRFSWNANRRLLLKRSVTLIADAISRLVYSGGTELRADPTACAEFPARVYSGPDAALPSVPRAIHAAFMLIFRVGRRVIRGPWLTKLQWQILVANDPQQIQSLSRYTRLIPPKRVFWADPFALQRSTEPNLAGSAILVEEFDFRIRRGRISLLAADAAGLWTSTPVIDNHFHYSYPFVFHYRNRPWLVPECHQSRSIDIYRCDDFPFKWTRHMTLMDNISAADTTIFHWGGTWWMFTNINRHGRFGDHHTELFVFSSANPISNEWVAHGYNPVVTDISQARNGGRVFVNGQGRLIRPVQDCAARYGSRLRFFEITELTLESYAQREVATIEPHWSSDVTAIHHFDYSPGFIAADAEYRVRRGP